MNCTTGQSLRNDTSQDSEKKPVILFDGVCNLCNGFVRVVIGHDKDDRFRLMPLQSASALIDKVFPTPLSAESVVLFENGIAYFESDAVIRIAARLGGSWRLLSLLSFLPKFLRDALYRILARFRYDVFGKMDSCMVPKPDIIRKFISEEELSCLLRTPPE